MGAAIPVLGDLLARLRPMPPSEIALLVQGLVMDEEERHEFDWMAEHTSSHETLCLVAARAIINEAARRERSRAPTPPELVGQRREKIYPESGRYSIVPGQDFAGDDEDTEDQCPAAKSARAS